MPNEIETIAILDSVRFIHLPPDRRTEICDALKTAMQAIRAQQEREKGCEWCKVGQDNARTVWIDGSFDAFTGDSYGEGASHKGIIDRKAAYCPMCGRRLEVEQ